MEVGIMVQVLKQLENSDVDVLRQCPTCERCRDCGYTHIGIACPDPDPDFDGTCLCDEVLRIIAWRRLDEQAEPEAR
jgi:hypothetical protein